MALPVTPGSGANVATDFVGGEHHQQLVIEFGAAGTPTRITPTSPLPVREPVKGSALGKGGITSSGASQTVVAANANRTMVEISNAGANGLWLSFGSAAVVGQGTYLPSKATGYWPTTAAVAAILETGGVAGPIGYTEW